MDVVSIRHTLTSALLFKFLDRPRFFLLVSLVNLNGVELGNQVLFDKFLGLLIYLIDLDSKVSIDRPMV